MFLMVSHHPGEAFRIIMDAMQNLLNSKARSQFRQLIRDQIDAGNLRAATAAVEERVAVSGDGELIEVARQSATDADLDWADPTAEAIEADHHLQNIGQTGCRVVVLELSSQPATRDDITRHYYGPPTAAERGGRTAGYFGRLNHPMRVTGLDQLAEIERRPYPRVREEQEPHQWKIMLAGHLLVLRFFGAVQRCGESFGLPFRTRLQVGVESIGGEAAISQVDPRFSMEVTCAVRPVSGEVEDRLRQRHAMQVLEWHKRTEKLLHDLREHFETHGYAPSRMLPDELGEERHRLQHLERTLTLFEPGNRMTWRQFEALLVRVRQVRNETVPPPVDTGRYR